MAQHTTSPTRTASALQILSGIPAAAIYAYICWKSIFVQDDAFISYRYVLNALSGHGLVYNIGERIEGFTNFGWVVLLLMAGKLGFNIMLTSMIVGFLCGLGVLLVTWLTARVVLKDYPWWYSLAAVYIVAINGALAYWSPAGLETAAFAFMAVFSLYFFLTGSWLLIASLLIAVWLRPDGAVVAALLIAIEAIITRKLPRFAFLCAASAFGLSLPFVGFKLSYYGSLFPNPFYAKTTTDLSQISNGLEYTAQFLTQYGFLGITMIAPVIFWKRLTRPQRAIVLFLAGYMLYVTAIGGDVLKIHRFYLPVFGPSAILVSLTMALVFGRLRLRGQQLAVAVVTVILMAVTWFVPRSTIAGYLEKERGFTFSMQWAGHQLEQLDQSNFTVATSTIGSLGYSLMGHRVIDMVGLTDSTVARHPESRINGIISTWKENSFNASYVLSQAPEYIVLATGSKPSSPGEQALFLYSSFLDSYRLSTLGYFPNLGVGEPRPFMVFRKVRPVRGPIRADQPVAFVSLYKRGIELRNSGKYHEALDTFRQAERQLHNCVYPELLYYEAYVLLALKEFQQAGALLDATLAVDSLTAGPHRDLYMAAAFDGDTAKAAIHRRYLAMLSPGDLHAVDSVVNEAIRTAKK